MKKIAHHPLKVWLFEHDETQAEFAERAGISQSVVSYLINGKCNPTMAIVKRVSAATKGAITANDLQ